MHSLLSGATHVDISDEFSSNSPSPLAGEGWGEGSTPPTILLHGVTASGKTEVYFKLIKDCIDAGKNVLFLAPEIALASQLTKRLAKKFGTEDVAIWHTIQILRDGHKFAILIIYFSFYVSTHISKYLDLNILQIALI